jgi:hypothetical protein
MGKRDDLERLGQQLLQDAPELRGEILPLLKANKGS